MNQTQKRTAFNSLMTARMAAKGISASFFENVAKQSALSNGSSQSRNSSGK